jgi:LysR family glycine cleavage system transcriptional activator
MSALPPLNALRAFEAAARTGGFAAAAEELNVTPAAVGQQVRQLEALVGAPLFNREGRRLVLSARGAAAVEPLRRAFQLMGEASAALREADSVDAVTLAATSDLAATWLAEDLSGRDMGGWGLASWDRAVRLSVIEAGTGEADLSLVYAQGRFEAPGAERLMGETLAPLAAPGVLAEGAGLDRLDGAALIEDISAPGGWAGWLAARGGYGRDNRPALRASGPALALALAEAGRGVVLARKPLAFEQIRTGRLVPVFPDGDWSVAAGYHLVVAPGLRLSTPAAALADLLRARAAARGGFAGEL